MGIHNLYLDNISIKLKHGVLVIILAIIESTPKRLKNYDYSHKNIDELVWAPDKVHRPDQAL